VTRLPEGLSILTATALAVFGFAPEAVRPWIVGFALVLFGISLSKPGSLPSAWCLLVAAIVSFKTFLPAYDTWPLHLAIPLLLVAAYSALTPRPTPLSSWSAPGSFGPGIKIVTTVIAAASVIGLALWMSAAHPHLTPPRALRDLSLVALLPVACAFASVNAVIEELAFRGIALHALSVACKHDWVAIVLQAVAFGALHYSTLSIPSGLPGAGLTCLFGIALGVLARLAEGIFAPCLAHFVADLVVFGLMVQRT
jgi:hypothetical protein